MIGAPVTVYTGGDTHKWRVSHIKQGIGASITITHELSEMIVDKSWFMFDTSIGSLVLQRLGVFSDNTLKRTTNSSEIWRNILHSDKMMDGEILMVLLEWTIHGNPSREELGLPKAQNTSWLVDRSFWQSWVQNNEPRIVPLVTSKEWVCIDREPTWGTEVSRNVLCKLLDTCFSTRATEGDTSMRQYALLDLDRSSVDRVQFMTCDYIKGTEGHYMPKESFLYLRKYERMIEKITFPTPIHLLDHIVIPIHICKSHWFPAHINLRTRSISMLDSSRIYNMAAYPHQRMLIWKFFRMVWTTHAEAAAPVLHWTIPPERFIGLHPRLTDVTPRMIQILGQCAKATTTSTMDTTTDKIKSRWIRRGISPEMAGSRPKDPPVQHWTYTEQPGTPEQDNFTNTTETRLACGISSEKYTRYTIVSSWSL